MSQEFDEWVKESGYDGHYVVIAEDAWDAALEAASKHIIDHVETDFNLQILLRASDD